jgi:chemotaxis regulatin CheY-phosphate phosphatase CheZ
MNKEQIADILTTAADFVFLSIDQQGKIMTANPAVRKIFNLQEGEVEGKQLSQLVPDVCLLEQTEFQPIQPRGGLDSFGEDDIQQSDCIYLEALAAKEASGERHTCAVLVDGETKWIELETCKLQHHDSIIFTVIIYNITRRKNAELEILDLNQSLEQKVLERTAELESRTDQVKKIVNTCSEELQTINNNYQVMKERQMDLMENLSQHLVRTIKDLSPQQVELVKSTLNQQLQECMHLYSEDQITDQKFLLAIITLNELFSGKTQAQDNLKPGQLSGTSQNEVDDLLDSLGI